MGFPYNYPLGLPKGTVRATIALVLSLTLFVLVLREDDMASSLGTTVALILAFYFGGRLRGTMTIGSNADPSERAFGLPAGTVRCVLFLGFAGLYVYLWISELEIPNYIAEFALMMVGFIIGSLFNGIKHKLFRVKKGEPTMWFEHLKAFLVLSWMGVVVFACLISDVPISEDVLFFSTYVVTGFYYGERK